VPGLLFALRLIEIVACLCHRRFPFENCLTANRKMFDLFRRMPFRRTISNPEGEL
jgi:hypothetical protein